MFPLRTRQRGADNMAVGAICGRENATVGVRYGVRTPEAVFRATPISCTLSRTGSTVTGTATAHLLVPGDTCFITGADQPEYNGPQRVLTTADANTFTYAVTTTPADPATGTITVAKVIS